MLIRLTKTTYTMAISLIIKFYNLAIIKAYK